MKRFFILHSFTLVLLRNVQQIYSCDDGFYRNGIGSCVRCPDNCLFCSSEKYCLSCKNGYAGKNCDFFCSQCLQGTSCDKVTHFCSHGCRDGLSGALCDINCHEKCLSCNRTDQNVCLACDTGRYGAECVFCPVSCTNHVCDQQGFCTLGCKPGHWGQMCEKVCSEQCINNVCVRGNGTCEGECEDGSTGSNCEKGKEKVSTVVAITVVVTVIFLAASIFCLKVVYTLRRKISKTDKTIAEGSSTDEKERLRDTENENVEPNKAEDCELQVIDIHNTSDITRRKDDNEIPDLSNDQLQTKRKWDTTKQTILEYLTKKSLDSYKKEMTELHELDGTKRDIKYRRNNEKKNVAGFGKEKSYVTSKDVTDWKSHWQWIFDGHSDVIVYFTDEENVPHDFCKKTIRGKLYGDIHVRCIRETNTKWLSVKIYNLQKENKGTESQTATGIKTVTIYQCTVHPHETANDEEILPLLHKFVRNAKSKKSGPYFVHCSKECDGYAGLFIALDILIDEAENTGKADIFGCVSKILDLGVSVAETLKHYKLLHEVLKRSLSLIHEDDAWHNVIQCSSNILPNGSVRSKIK